MKTSLTLFFVLFYIFVSFSFISLNFAQSDYNTVSDIDSYAYVTAGRSLLVLKRDSLNYLQYHNSFSIPGYDYLYSKIIDPYLFICTESTLYLYSIYDRENPVFKDEMHLGDLLRLENFGPYIIAVRRQQQQQDIISVENDSLRVIKYIEKNCRPYFSENTCRELSFSYPYIFTINSDYTCIEMIKYDSLQNTLNTLFCGDYRSSSNYHIVQIIANYSNLCFLEDANNYGNIIKYEIIADTLNFIKLLSGITGPPVIDIWEENDRFIAHIKDVKDSRTNSYTSYLTNIDLWNYSKPVILTETNVYQPGSKLFYTQRITSDSLIFEDYVFAPPSSIIIDKDNSIKEYSLKQNYPNPFNPVTTISYQIPERSFVTLKVYDVLGNEVATLVKEEKPAGSYQVEWNALSLPSGIYFYRMRAGNFIQSRKMILLK